MLHENRNKVLQIRLSEQEYSDLQNWCSVNTNLNISSFARVLILSYLAEVYIHEQND